MLYDVIATILVDKETGETKTLKALIEITGYNCPLSALAEYFRKNKMVLACLPEIKHAKTEIIRIHS